MILCSGAFDGLHSGHVRYLTAARKMAQGAPLVVAVAPDAYIQQHKGRAPFWAQADRMETVAALSVVDSVVAQEGVSVAETITRLHPDVFVKGADWLGALPADVLAACADVECQIAYVDTPGRHVREARA